MRIYTQSKQKLRSFCSTEEREGMLYFIITLLISELMLDKEAFFYLIGYSQARINQQIISNQYKYQL